MPRFLWQPQTKQNKIMATGLPKAVATKGLATSLLQPQKWQSGTMGKFLLSFQGRVSPKCFFRMTRFTLWRMSGPWFAHASARWYSGDPSKNHLFPQKLLELPLKHFPGSFAWSIQRGRVRWGGHLN